MLALAGYFGRVARVIGFGPHQYFFEVGSTSVKDNIFYPFFLLW